MTTMKVRNISGSDRDVPTPDGQVVTVVANHQAEFDTDHAKGLLSQSDVWEKVSDAPKKKDED